MCEWLKIIEYEFMEIKIPLSKLTSFNFKIIASNQLVQGVTQNVHIDVVIPCEWDQIELKMGEPSNFDKYILRKHNAWFVMV